MKMSMKVGEGESEGEDEGQGEDEGNNNWIYTEPYIKQMISKCLQCIKEWCNISKSAQHYDKIENMNGSNVSKR